MNRYLGETPTGLVRSYFSYHKFGTVKSCMGVTGLREDQVRTSIQVLRKGEEIEYRGKHGQGIYVVRGYRNGSEDERRRRMLSLVTANERYRQSIAESGVSAEDNDEDRAEKESPESYRDEDEWDILKRRIGIEQEKFPE